MLADRGKALQEPYVSAVDTLAEEIAENLFDEDDFEKFFELSVEAENLEAFPTEARFAAKHSLEAYVASELDNLNDSYEDPRDMDERIGELESLARRHGIDRKLSSKFSWAREKIYEMDHYEPSYDYRPTNAEGAISGNARDTAYRRSRPLPTDTAQTEGLFLELA